MDEENDCKCPPPGAPAWMATFSDLMALLMCFFVLLLSFSEMDVLKFQQIAGSVKYAFGVQNRLEVKDIPKGTSVIAQEFRPGRPEPTPIDVIMQQTVDVTQRTLDFQDGESSKAGGTKREDGKQTGGDTPETSTRLNQNDESEIQQQEAESMELKSSEIKNALSKEIEKGSVDVENLGQQIVIRIREHGSFPEGSAFLQPKYRQTIRQVATLVKDVPGIVQISGHTDNVRLDSELYRSNWDLSAQRAVSVAHEMQAVEGFDRLRIRVRGMADAEPFVANDTREHRLQNRRVEIRIMQGKPHFSEPISSNPEGYTAAKDLPQPE